MIDRSNLPPILDPSNPPAFDTEDQMNAWCFQWAWNERPQTRRLLFHVPNEVATSGKRGMIQRVQNKAKGVVAGIADFVFLWNRCGVMFEGKMLNGSQSDDQIKVQACCQMHHVPYHIYRTPLEFQQLIDFYINQ